MVYLNEPVTQKEAEDGGDAASGLTYGVCEMQGWRRNMEDAHLAIPELDDKVSLFGVFDGHGGKGVSAFAAKRLPGLLKETEAYKRGDFAKALEQAFLAVDEELKSPGGRQEIKALDQPNSSSPISLPRRVLQRLIAGSAARGGTSPLEEEADEAQEEVAAACEDEDAEPKPPEAAALREGEAAEAPESGEAAGGTKQQVEVSPEAGAEGVGAPEPPTPAFAQVRSEARGPKDLGAPEPVSAKLAEADGEAKKDDQSADDSEAETKAEEAEFELADDDDEGDDDEIDGSMANAIDVDDDEHEEEMALVDPCKALRNPTPEAQGCTAVVVLVVREENGEGPRLYCANAGDSRAIMSRGGQVLPLSEDHKPENREETARITKAGGFVQHMPGGARVQGDLNLSRAMGDLRYKQRTDLKPEEQIVTAFPEVRTFPLTAEDEFMVIGCDGIWDTNGNQEMIDFVRPRLKVSAVSGKAIPLSQICNEICDKGLCPSMDPNENEAFDGTGCDNMTVVVVRMKEVAGGDAKKRPAEEPADECSEGVVENCKRQRS